MPINSEDMLIGELDKINLAIQKLYSFEQKSENLRLQDLPDDLQQLIKSIKIMPPRSSTGLEDIKFISEDLHMSRYVIQRTLNGEKDEPEIIKNIKTEEQKNIGTKEQIDSETKELKNQNITPAPRPRPKFVEQTVLKTEELKNKETEEPINQNNIPTPRPKQNPVLGIMNKELGEIKIQDKKDDTLVNLKDISHIEQLKPKVVTTKPNPPSPSSNLPQTPSPKKDLLDPFDQN